MTGPLAKLAELGHKLPEVVPPVASYLPAVQSGQHVYVSGQLPMAEGKLLATGKVGAGVSADQAKDLAQRCALNALAAINSLVGLENVVKVVKLTGFVASARASPASPASSTAPPTFSAPSSVRPVVMRGARWGWPNCPWTPPSRSRSSSRSRPSHCRDLARPAGQSP